MNKEAPDDVYMDFKGWRFRAPFRCMKCGCLVTARQWAFSRSCGPCDCGSAPTGRGVFSGPRELVDANAQYFIPAERFESLDAQPIDRAPRFRTGDPPKPKRHPFRFERFNPMGSM